MSCEEPDCDGPVRSRGLCRKHYNRLWYKANPRPKVARKTKPKRRKRTCMHLDCQQQPRLRFTWPQPIQRQEIACETHAVALLQAGVQGLTIEHIGAEE